MRLSDALHRALDTRIVDQNARLRVLLDDGLLSPDERELATKIFRHNEEELRDPVMGRYYHGHSAAAMEELSRIPDSGLQRHKAYRLSIAASISGDWHALRAMRDGGIRISALRGRHGYAAGYAVDYPRCLAEFLDDGMDPNTEWTVDDDTSDLMTRTAEVNGRPDVIRLLVARGARCTCRALVRALQRNHDAAAVELIKTDPRLAVPKQDQTGDVLEALYRVHGTLLEGMRLEVERASEERDRALADHRRFVSIEFPALLTQAIGAYSAENRVLKAALGSV